MMGSLGSPKTWIPYMNTKDCSQGFCSLYCPQWCYILIPPPPAHAFEFPQDNSSSPNFSPLVVAVIGILVSAFLLVSYYTVISKYCGNEDRRGRRDDHDLNMELGDTHQNPSSIHEAWHVTTPGLDEALIKSLTVCKYKKGDGFVDGTDCAVCLSEFEEDESLRLLPKCNHAFHLPCIDTWLTSHSNCPLCRANIVSPHHVVTENPPLANHDATLAESQGANDQNLAMEQDSERGSSQNFELHAHGDHVIPKRSSMRGLSDFRNSEQRESTIIQIGGDPEEYHHQRIRRSVSMDHSPPNQVLVADILSINEEEEEEEDDDDDYQEDKNIHDHGGGCSDSESAGGVGKSSHRKGLLHCVKSPVAMKRSFSSGRICLSRPSRARHTVIPV